MRKVLKVLIFLSFLLVVVRPEDPTINDEVLGLIAFKANLHDPDSKLISWNVDDNNPCNWVGVKCDVRTNRVTEVALNGLSLSGRIGRCLLQLKFLQRLSLSKNNFTGSIDPGLARLSSLQVIDLSENSFSGPIPEEFFEQCMFLKEISLARNGFSGAIPQSLSSCSTLLALNLSSNGLSGQVPSWIGEMRSLETLDLSGNGFLGTIPDTMGNLNLLKVLNFSGNGLTGSLPESMSSCKSLMVVDFSQNFLTGNLPGWVFKLGLQRFSVSQNELTSRVESSPSESTEPVHENLQVLDLSDNKFSGTIPSGIGVLRSLHILKMSRNSLMGVIPASIGALKDIDVLDLSENRLTGEIPSQIGDCSSLTSLILSHNYLTGPIPAKIANLSNLQTIDFSLNNLTGTIPKQLGNLIHLFSFNVSHNHLEGELPLGSFFNTISPSSLSGNPSLCGAAVNRSCRGVLPKPIVLNPNSSTNPSTPGSSSNIHPKKIILSISALIAIGAAAVIALGVVTITVLNLRARSAAPLSAAAPTMSGGDEDCSQSPTTDANSGKLVMFSGDPNFSASTHTLLNKDCELGRGGFGAVYQAVLHDGRPVAIKKLTVSSLVKSQEDFEREVKKLGKIRHPNLVMLEGYYWTPSLQLLIYEFVPGGSLYKHLHESSASNSLSWQERFDIIVGTAKSLAYLHQLNVIHYNLKSSNVLIDGSGEPKVGDFGLAKLLPMLDRYVLSSKMQSALGYMAPEFACRGVKITEKCDVYGFGILVLEVVTGRRPVEYMEDDVVVLSDMVRGALEEGQVEECVDGRLQGEFPAEEAVPLMKLGLICTSQVPSNRPDMGEVVNILELIKCTSEGQEESS
ncbi:probable LRR receptor-like serine/threonine-protein kinase IRK isoform X2 [Magnolia sinica]|uniref:probable LRR receptor-like serine/threonine-protein kinase IRK isoform X2 n=1 Tax=Magnolia sinica TaxID=86752 RepID=UPI002658494C|nr:probable LRR receptor-like serine/threonine-protein kinase IRK isoform X2 [Magnolia sinica]